MKYKIGLIILGAAMLLFYVGQSIGTTAVTAATPGSADDPLVTKGYVDQRIQEALGGGVTGGTVELDKQLEEYSKKIDEMIANASGQLGGNELIVIQLFPGDRLVGHAGTEMIVRTGKTSIISEADGIPDVTSGTDLAKGKVVPLNHQLIIPRHDGRGIEADKSSDQPVYVMVRGGYDLTRAQ